MSHVGILTLKPGVEFPVVPAHVESWKRHQISIRGGANGTQLRLYADGDLTVREDGSFCAFSGELYESDGNTPIRGTEAASRILESMPDLASLAQIDAAAGITTWHPATRRLIIARDPVGGGSLFYTLTPERLIWASRLRDLVAILPSVSELPEAVDAYLAIGMIPSPWTIYEEISRLGAGEAIVVEDTQLEVQRYHVFDTSDPDPESSRYNVLAKEFPIAVRRRLEGDRTGVLSSGGVDSSLLLIIAAHELGHGPPSFTFEYGGYDGPMNEAPHARKTAEIVDSPHHLLHVDPSAIPEEISKLIDSAGEPLLRAIHTAMLGGVIEADALLLGEGADGLYLKSSEVLVLSAQAVPDPLLAVASKGTELITKLDHAYASRTSGMRLPPFEFISEHLHWPISRALSPRPRRLEEHVLPFLQRAEIYADPERANQGYDALQVLMRQEWDNLDSESLESKLRLLHLRFGLADDLLRRTLDIAQSNGIPLRAPFASRPLLAGWVRQPADWTLRRELRRSQGANKPEIRQLAGEIAPAGLSRKPKQKHSAPMDSWLRDPLRPWLEEILSPEQISRDGLFDPEAVARLLEQHMSGRSHGWNLWALATLTIWRNQARSGPGNH